jgi:hypothetical protein
MAGANGRRSGVDDRFAGAEDTLANRVGYGFQRGTLYVGETLAYGGIRLGDAGMGRTSPPTAAPSHPPWREVPPCEPPCGLVPPVARCTMPMRFSKMRHTATYRIREMLLTLGS